MLIDHIDYAVINDCINAASYGEICVKCNACGRFNKETQRECALRVWIDELYDQFHFNAWFDDEEIKALQKKNIESNIEFIQDKILSLLAEAMKEGWHDRDKNLCHLHNMGSRPTDRKFNAYRGTVLLQG